jgi:hypothetical protein
LGVVRRLSATPSFGLAANAIAVGVEAVVVFSHDRDRAGVLGAVAAAAFAVVVRCVGIQTSAGVIGVAFGGFFFGFGFFRFFGFGFGLPPFPLTLPLRCSYLGTTARLPASRFSVRFRAGAVNSSLPRDLTLGLPRLSRFGGFLALGIAVGPATDAEHEHRDREYRECAESPSRRLSCTASR